MGQLSQSQDLGAGLKSRHVTMLSIAGVIGASLLSAQRHCRGRPAVLLAYLFAGLLVVMISVCWPKWRSPRRIPAPFPPTPIKPSAAGRGIPSAGYTGGSGLVIPLEANIAAIILHSWVPGVPVWLFSPVITRPHRQ